MRRRAAFLSSALAAVGCSSSSHNGAQSNGQEPGATSQTPVVTVPVPAMPSSAPAETVRPEDPPPKPKMGERPAYDVPKAVSDTAKQNYQHLHKTMKELHRMLDDMETTLPACDIAKPDCQAAFRLEADQWHEINRTLRFFHLCPGKSKEAQTFDKHRSAHDRHLRARIATVEQRVVTAAGDPARWDQIKSQQAKPHPCLSFACPDW
jgi:hypothetical protein